MFRQRESNERESNFRQAMLVGRNFNNFDNDFNSIFLHGRNALYWTGVEFVNSHWSVVVSLNQFVISQINSVCLRSVNKSVLFMLKIKIHLLFVRCLVPLVVDLC